MSSFKLAALLFNISLHVAGHGHQSLAACTACWIDESQHPICMQFFPRDQTCCQEEACFKARHLRKTCELEVLFNAKENAVIDD